VPKIEITVSMGHDIGVNRCVETSSEDIEAGRIFWAYQPGRDHRSRFILGQADEPTDEVSLILWRHRGRQRLDIISAWVGRLVKPEDDEEYWETHAHVLNDLEQIDTGKPIRLDYGEEEIDIDILTLQGLFEDRERELSVAATIKHMQRGGFRERYINTQILPQQQSLKKLKEKIELHATRLAKKDLTQFVAESLGTSIDMIQNEQGWRILTRIAKKAIDIDQRETRLKLFTKTRLTELAEDDEYVDILGRLQSELEWTKKEAEEKIDILLHELDARKDEPALVEAASWWTNAPDSRYDDEEVGPNRGSLGLNGRGWSGGLIHFFEYRASVKKRRRFKGREDDEPMTIEGFIAFTNKIKAAVIASEKAIQDFSVPTENTITVLEDSRGNQRYYIVLPGGDLILAYKKLGQSLKISTLITHLSETYVEKVIELSLSGQDRGRINVLGPTVERVGNRAPSAR
jgi:hypothetical protein